MPTLSYNISEAEIEKLNYERYAYRQPMVQKRIFSVYLKAVTKFSNSTIGLITGLHPNMVSYWIGVYKEKGFDGLLTNNYGTTKSKLEEHAENILCSFSQRPPMNAAEATQRIREMTGINRSEQQVRAFMKRHGLRFIKCGHIPAKADNEAQNKWVETELKPVVEAAQQQQVHLLFCDAAHFVLQPFLCSLWCSFRVFIKASAGRNRINVLGAVNAITKEVITLSNTTYITSATLIEFLKMLKEKYSDKPIAIVLDNARYQHCFVVKTIARSFGIHLLFLPPYSPNLNIIERLWKFTKKKILYAKYYHSPQEFHQAIQNFFNDINQNFQEELTSLLSLKFQFFDNKKTLIYPL
ncbi:MAG: IS630 family transposase [Segetibacter sp.]